MAIESNLPSRVRLVEVGPRDGLQNEQKMVPADTKVALIDLLTAAGCPAIEATSFVSPKWVPQMADAADVMARIRRTRGCSLSGAHTQRQGLRRGARGRRRRGRGVRRRYGSRFRGGTSTARIAESLERAAPIFAAAKAHGVRVRGYISCVLGCPYEGDVEPGKVADVAHALFALGAYEVSLGDTIGVGTAGATKALLAAVAERVPVAALAGHFHDTYGQALTNVYAAMQMGVATFDSSVAGLGGCPYAKGATGNVASEDVLYLLNGLGIDTGIDMAKLRAAGQFISDFLGRPPMSRVARALAAREPLRGARSAAA